MSKKSKEFDPYVIRTRNLLIWSQTRYRCAKESLLQVILFMYVNQTLRNNSKILKFKLYIIHLYWRKVNVQLSFCCW